MEEGVGYCCGLFWVRCIYTLGGNTFDIYCREEGEKRGPSNTFYDEILKSLAKRFVYFMYNTSQVLPFHPSAPPILAPICLNNNNFIFQYLTTFKHHIPPEPLIKNFTIKKHLMLFTLLKTKPDFTFSAYKSRGRMSSSDRPKSDGWRMSCRTVRNLGRSGLYGTWSSGML